MKILNFFVLVVLCGCTLTNPATPGRVPSWTDSPPRTAYPTGTAPSSLPSPFPTGAPASNSIGDAYTPELGTADLDVEQYDIQLTIDPQVEDLLAQVRVRGKALRDGLEEVVLDFVGFEIQSIESNGAVLNYRRSGDKLFISLAEKLPAGGGFDLVIRYQGIPEKRTSPFIPGVGNLGLLWVNGTVFAASEPDGTRFWLPCNDHPRDKATVRYDILVPAGITVAANGKLVSAQLNITGGFPDGRDASRFIWEHAVPVATYLMTVVAGPMQRIEDVSPEGVPLRHYLVEEDVPAFEKVRGDIGGWVDWLAARLGKYPFEEFGYTVIRGWDASLETQTLVLMEAQASDNPSVYFHELVHQWFGDWVSLDSWSEIWRNEGLATYLTVLYETQGDEGALEEVILQFKSRTTPSRYPLGWPPKYEMFSSPSYLKGAVLAHELRKQTGDEAFFAGLRSYFQKYGGRTASDAQFLDELEAASKIDLRSIYDLYIN